MLCENAISPGFELMSPCPIPATITLTPRATSLGQSGPGSVDNEGVLHIPQRSSITGVLPSDCLMSYPGPSPLRRDTNAIFCNPGRLSCYILHFTTLDFFLYYQAALTLAANEKRVNHWLLMQLINFWRNKDKYKWVIVSLDFVIKYTK